MEETEKQVIPYETTRVPDDSRFVGDEIIVSDGVDGYKLITKVDGEVVSTKTTQPRNQVVYYGTKEVENDLTPEAPQEEPTKQPSENVEVDTNPSEPVQTQDLSQPQGRFDKLVGILKAFVDKLIAIFSKEK